MIGWLQENPFQIAMVRSQACHGSDNLIEVPQHRSKWYFSKNEIDANSPSRKDGIDLVKENQLRMQYCSFLQELGMKLGMPQVTIATSMIFCHRFYLRQSHARNDWQSLATVCLFLASKVEEPACSLSKVTLAAYEMIYRKDPAAIKRIQSKDVYEKQKELIVMGERLLLTTIEFDVEIQHPYKPLVAAIKKLGISESGVLRVAWNFVNDWLRTTLCLQYKPHYIAAGSIYLAAKLNKVKLPSEKGHVWWHEFDIMPRQFEEVIQEMMELFGYKRNSMVPCANRKESPAPVEVQKEASCSPESCVLSRPGSSSSTGHDLCGDAGGEEGGGDEAIRHVNDGLSSSLTAAEGITSTDENIMLRSHAQDGILDQETASNDGNKVVCEGTHAQASESPDGILDQETASNDGKKVVCEGQGHNLRATGLASIPNIDRERIRATLKRRRQERELSKVIAAGESVEDAWIEMELERELDHVREPDRKKSFL